jgi:pSer/pThr/pTyr-binding forkhead associated (FHA) protein
MKITLTVEKRAGKAQTFTLRSKDTIVGRGYGCAIRIPSDSVSRRHCRLIFHHDYLTVEDLASVNGTSVNGQVIAKPTILQPGDRLTLGSVTFLVQYQLTPKAIEKLLEEQEKEMELLPIFDANSSSLPVILPEKKSDSQEKKKDKKAPKKKVKPNTKKLDQEKNPDASSVLGGKRWQLPSGEDIRDILSKLDED